MGDFSVVPIANPGDVSDDERLKGKQLRLNNDGRAEYLDSEPVKASVMHASLSGPSPTFHTPTGMQGTSSDQAPAAHRQMSQAPVQRAKTPDELMAMAKDMLATQSAQHEAQLNAGPSTGVRNDAGGKIPDWLVAEMKRNDDQ